jgi:predicted nucleotidyltransferase
MIRSSVISALEKLAVSLGPAAYGTEWHLFGSVNRDDAHASDIDIMILCRSDAQADLLRQAIDPDSLMLPLHLSLLTFDESAAIDAAGVQQSTIISDQFLGLPIE